MSSQLFWELLRNNNAFLVRRTDRDFTLDPFSNTGIQSYSGLGLIQKKAVGVSAKSTKNFTVSFKKRRRYVQRNAEAYKNPKTVNPDQSKSFFLNAVPIKHGVQRAAKVIKKRFGKRRSGLVYQALGKLIRLNKAVARRATHLKRAQKAAAAKKK